MFVTDHKHCTGCGACIDVCPQSAVVKIRDRYKFVYPSVQEDLCDFCGRCLEVCPKDKLIDRFPHKDFEQQYYVARAVDKQVLVNSHSGGIFHLLAAKFLSDGGVVYGCVFDRDRHPRHVRAADGDALRDMSGLKPVQSDTDGIYAAVKKDVMNGTRVLFSGTPCQCDGLLGYLGRRHANLTVVDMLCGGVTSEGVFHRYFYWLEHKLGDKIMSFRFENKQAFGMQRGIRILFRRGKQRFLLSFPLELDKLNAMSMAGVINRRSCGTCKYASSRRVGDISLGRFVNVRRAHPGFSYENGASLAVISTPKGAELFEQIHRSLICEPSDFERASANHLLVSPTAQSPKRKKVLSDIFINGFGSAAEKFKAAGVVKAAWIFCRAVIPDKAVRIFDRTAAKIKQSASAMITSVKNIFSDIKEHKSGSADK